MNSLPPIQVALVDDSPEFCSSISELLRQSPGLALVACCADVEEAVRLLPKLAPEVVLMDIHLPGRSGIAGVRELRQKLPEAALLMLTVEESGRKLLESIEAGADGYLVKTTPAARLIEAIREAHQGGSPISSHMARLLVQRFRAEPTAALTGKNLSAREELILQRLASGKRPKEVAEQLGISIHTVRAAVRSIYRKLHARSVPEAVARFYSPKGK